jgi:hypothetical protein
MKVDWEIDFHGYTAREMRIELDRISRRDEWRGWRRLRVIHGTGEVLGAELRAWCDERGVSWSPETHNPGALILHPFRSPKPERAPAHPPHARPAEKRGRRLTRPINPASSPEALRAARDLMKQEFDRLAEQPPSAIQKRKHGTDPR